MDSETNNTKFVDFEKWCKKCKYAEASPTGDPCNHCLGVGGRDGTDKPVDYEEVK